MVFCLNVGAPLVGAQKGRAQGPPLRVQNVDGRADPALQKRGCVGAVSPPALLCNIV